MGNRISQGVIAALSLSLQGLVITEAHAQCVPSAQPGLVCPSGTSGKEYSTRPDTDSTLTTFSPSQTLLWTGGDNGPSGVANGFNYARPNDQVDAMANTADHLYYHELPGKSVDRDEVHMLFNVGNEAVIRYETQQVAQSATWGKPLSNGSVDALEVWGGEGLAGADANRFSLDGDPYGVSVYRFDKASGRSSAWITQSQIGEAIGLDREFWGRVDLDALMVGDFDKHILFSIAPIAGFDGGEIWTWDLSKAPASFLKHGGHLWDTAFDVQGTYKLLSEDVTLLEAVDVSAVPEPETQTLVLAGLLVAGVLFRRRQSALNQR